MTCINYMLQCSNNPQAFSILLLSGENRKKNLIKEIKHTQVFLKKTLVQLRIINSIFSCEKKQLIVIFLSCVLKRVTHTTIFKKFYFIKSITWKRTNLKICYITENSYNIHHQINITKIAVHGAYRYFF